MTSPLVESFPDFLSLTWSYLSLPSPTPVQLDIADYLQHGPRRKVIEAFRGVGKSWITTAYAAWHLLRNPDTKILVVSASKTHSDNFSTFLLQLINGMDELHHLKPREDQRQAKIMFDVGPAKPSRDPSVRSVGITGQLTGSRANLIIPDDIEVPNNSLTTQMRDKLAESIKEFDAILKPDGEITYLGTPQTEQSIYKVLPNRGYQVRVWPARFPTEAQRPTYGDTLSPKVAARIDKEPHKAGTSTDPRRFSDADLTERELSYGRSGFALQFMLDTSLSDANRYPLKLADLIIMSLDQERAPEWLSWASGPEQVWKDLPSMGFAGDAFYRPMGVSEKLLEYAGCVMAIDPSGRGKDELGYAIVKTLNGYLYVVACGGLPGGYREDNLVALANLAKRHKVHLVVVEPNMGDGMFNQLLAPIMARIHPCRIEDTERSSAQKEARIIDCLEPVMNRHRLVVDRRVVEDDYRSIASLPAETGMKYSLFYQMTRITRDRKCLAHDDRLDALSLAIHYWVSIMGQDEEKQIAARKAHADDDYWAKFLAECDMDQAPSNRYSAAKLW